MLSSASSSSSDSDSYVPAFFFNFVTKSAEIVWVFLFYIALRAISAVPRFPLLATEGTYSFIVIGSVNLSGGK